MKLTYAEQLRHPMWQKRRLEMLSAANWKCSACSAESNQLHVHHKQYFKGRMAWEYSDTELQVLCDECHLRTHEIDTRIKTILARVSPQEALALLVGFFGDAVDDSDSLRIYEEQCHLVELGNLAACLRGQDIELISNVWGMVVDADMERLNER